MVHAIDISPRLQTSGVPRRKGLYTMPTLATLINMTMILAHQLAASSLKLECSPLIAARPFFAHQIGDAAATLLAQVADVQLLSRQGYFSKLEALAVLSSARKSGTELTALLRSASLRGYVTEEETAPLVALADETVACLLAVKMALRETAVRGRAA